MSLDENSESEGLGENKKLKEKVEELKNKDKSDAELKANNKRLSLEKNINFKNEEKNKIIDEKTTDQLINSQKLLSKPGVYLYDSPIETRFLRNTDGEVIGKEFFVTEYYLKETMSMSEEIKVFNKCFTIKYSLEITGDLVDKETSINVEVFNWKLFNNKLIDLIIGIICLGSVIAFFALKSKYGYFGIFGLFLGLFDTLSGLYHKYINVEINLNNKAKNLFKKWVNSVQEFKQLTLTSYSRKDKCVLIIEAVERTMKQTQAQTIQSSVILQEHEGLIKSGFGKTLPKYVVFDNTVILKNGAKNIDIIRPAILLLCQLAVLVGSSQFLLS